MKHHLEHMFNQYMDKNGIEECVPEEISLKRGIAIFDTAIGINKIDGFVLSDEYIEKLHDMVYGRIKRSKFAEYVLRCINEQYK